MQANRWFKQFHQNIIHSLSRLMKRSSVEADPGFRVGVFVRMRTDGRTLKLLHRLTRAWHQAHRNKDPFTAWFVSICPFHCSYLDRWHDATNSKVFPPSERKGLRKVLKDSKLCPPARVSCSYPLDTFCSIFCFPFKIKMHSRMLFHASK